MIFGGSIVYFVLKPSQTPQVSTHGKAVWKRTRASGKVKSSLQKSLQEKNKDKWILQKSLQENGFSIKSKTGTTVVGKAKERQERKDGGK
jgi:hypothetical protein